MIADRLVQHDELLGGKAVEPPVLQRPLQSPAPGIDQQSAIDQIGDRQRAVADVAARIHDEITGFQNGTDQPDVVPIDVAGPDVDLPGIMVRIRIDDRPHAVVERYDPSASEIFVEEMPRQILSKEAGAPAAIQLFLQYIATDRSCLAHPWSDNSLERTNHWFPRQYDTGCPPP